MTRLTIVLAIGVMALNGSPAFGQEEEAEHEEFRHHRIALFTGYTWVPQGDHHGNVSGVVVVPTLGLDYQYWVSHRFALGVINDFELSTYVIEQSDGSQLTREYAYVGAAVAIWEAVESLAIFAGPGVELEKHENFFVVKVEASMSSACQVGGICRSWRALTSRTSTTRFLRASWSGSASSGRGTIENVGALVDRLVDDDGVDGHFCEWATCNTRRL